MMRYVGVGALVIAGLLLAPQVTSAQAISGTVTDTSGSVLPGVSVEARSPAPTEEVRTDFTQLKEAQALVSVVYATLRGRFVPSERPFTWSNDFFKGESAP